MFTTKINPTLSPDCLHWKDDDGRRRRRRRTTTGGGGGGDGRGRAGTDGDGRRRTMTEIAGVMGLMYARECLLMVLKESLHF